MNISFKSTVVKKKNKYISFGKSATEQSKMSLRHLKQKGK